MWIKNSEKIKCNVFDYLHPQTWQYINISHICTLVVCFGLLVSPLTIQGSGTPMKDNIEDIFVTRGKKSDFGTNHP